MHYNEMTEEQFVAYIEEEYGKMSEAEGETHDNTLILDPDFPYEIKKAIVYFGDPDSFGHEFFVAATKKENQAVERAVLNAIAILEKHSDAARHFGVEINPFIEYTPYETDNQRRVEADYNANFINKLQQNGLTQTKAKEIHNYLTNK